MRNFFLFTIALRPGLKPPQLRMCAAMPPIPHTSSWHGACLSTRATTFTTIYKSLSSSNELLNSNRPYCWLFICLDYIKANTCHLKHISFNTVTGSEILGRMFCHFHMMSIYLASVNINNRYSN